MISLFIKPEHDNFAFKIIIISLEIFVTWELGGGYLFLTDPLLYIITTSLTNYFDQPL